MYRFARSLLFRLSGEAAHEIALDAIGAAHRLKLTPRFAPDPVAAPVHVMGIDFPNAVGLAAGLDKNADYLDGLGALGFGFIEVGTVTPRPQPGNPKPRLFRIPEREVIINRMGFNNLGVDHLVERVKKSHYQGIIGINIGKNLTTPVERAVDDYLICLRKVYAHAHYVTVNVSSPNTPGLRALQYGEALDELLATLKTEQARLADEHGRYVPLAIKIAPDMSEDEVRLVARSLTAHKIDGVIATNTTLDRSAVKGLRNAEEAGGLSGAPLFQASTEVVRILADELKGAMPIIGVGGIHDAHAAVEKIKAGASLVQIYSGFVYHGPQLIKEAAQAIAELEPQPHMAAAQG